jgi:sulfoxide reductase heme-binding subunit YedZ
MTSLPAEVTSAPQVARPSGRRTRPAPFVWLKPAVVTGALVPLAIMAERAVRGRLGANPVAEALNELGLLALICLTLSLACTPLKIVLGVTWPIRVRKALGLLGFFYAVLHVATYAAIDQALNLRAIVVDIVERPFILVGFLAFVLLVPLAWTSTSKARKRMGAARWTRLHRLAYVCASLGVVHFLLRVKKDLSEPALYGAVIALLLGIRVLVAIRARPIGET